MNQFLNSRWHTWLHKANPAVKIALVMSMFLVTLFTHSLDFILYQALLFTMMLFALSGHPPWKVFLIVLPFILIFISSSSTMILFGKGDHLWWSWGLVRISEESFHRGIHIGFKSVAFAAEGLLFVLTTSSVDLFYALMQKFKLPAKFAYSFMASIRLLPMVWEEFQIRRQALQIRGIRVRGGLKGVVGQVKLYGVPLLAQSIRRASRVAVAMESKKFNRNRMRTYYYPSKYTRYDVYTVLLFGTVVAAAYWAGEGLAVFGITDVRYR
ncbi:energy-coupling factor transporter transmembrane protein EcfT [Paenibacillus sp. J22TS3]|uniref:energy-coupling factor transporter transmembrane component T family protein n=1 Tax=Paenibacillus sp. J22TS3 TaxID=2807192 RepID=UPI001B0EEDCF|nr:energy-coupling factor transporter transmembrane component T [Paenibacillus sp. J22TS3]GIP24089.1 cobalt ABC transporter permease [Paenibacillus sp. J22TS3]